MSLQHRTNRRPNRYSTISLESLETRHLLAASAIQVRAAGATGTEQMQLLVEEQVVASWSNIGGDSSTGEYQQFNYVHPTAVAPNEVRVAFVNDGDDGGSDRNLFVDGMSIDGLTYETESENVFSSGAIWTSEAGCTAGFFESEFLACDGFVQFAGTRVEVLAAGATGTELMQLEINGQIVQEWNGVGGDFDARQFVSYAYDAPSHVSVDDVRVIFANDGLANLQDRNLKVDRLVVGGIAYQAESATTFSTGSYDSSTGCAPGNKSTETLHCDGYLQFSGTRIEIRAAGSTGTESMELQIDGQTVSSWSNVQGDYNGRGFVTYTFDSPNNIDIDQVRVAFTNDGLAGAQDRNLRVDSVSLNGEIFEAEASTVLSTGTWTSNGGCNAGNKSSEFLHCSGYFQFAVSDNPGTLSLGTSLISVNEEVGSVTIPFVRSGGSDGRVTLDYTTINGTATAGSDYTQRSGTIVFEPGETNKSLVIPINNDNSQEGNETFTLSADRVGGGAGLGQPRTATITIVDDDQGPTPGTGNGLLGSYFEDIALSNIVFRRIDQTVNYDWGTGPPGAAINPDTFSVRWTGEIEPLYSQQYTFYTTSDDGVRLWVNDQLIIDQWIDQAATVNSGQITLQAGQRYDIRMEYYENAGDAVARLEWSSASQTREVVPQQQLYGELPSNIVGTFSGETVVSGLSQPISMEFAAGGRMFIAQQNGVVRTAVNNSLRSQPFIDISDQVNGVRDRGLLGMAVHPQFPSQPYVYLLFTYDPPETQGFSGSSLAKPDGIGNRVARLIRVTADPTTNYETAIPNSELVLLGKNSTWQNISRPDRDSTDDLTIPPSCQGVSDCLPTDSQSHTIGAVVFGNDGSLFVTVGDGTSYGRVDPRTVRVQDLDSLAGKVLRINPADGRGYADNPFFTGNATDNRSKVYSYGIRNSFRAAVHPVTGEVYTGDVGWTNWEEINVGAGKNFGWPYFEGGAGQSLRTSGYQNLAEAQAFYASNQPVEAPLWSRSHSDGARAVVLGDFYQGARYPSLLENALFFSDYGEPTVRALLFLPNGDVESVLQISGGVGVITEMETGTDGFMYYVDIANGRIGRLNYTEDVGNVQQQQANLVANGGASSGVSVIQRSDDVVDVYTKSTDEQIVFDPERPEIVTVDGVDHILPLGVSRIVIRAGGGEDQVTVLDTAGNDSVHFTPGSVDFRFAGLRVFVKNAETVEAIGGRGNNDRAYFYDSIRNDSFVSRPGNVAMVGAGYSHRATDFDTHVAYASHGNDVARMYGTNGNDTYRAELGIARLTSPIQETTVNGFDRTVAWARNGQNDRAIFVDSVEDETFIATPTHATWENSTNRHRANGFDIVIGSGGSGNDIAHLYDSAGDDFFFGHAAYARMTGEGYRNTANGFDNVFGHASTSENQDRAVLFDSAAADLVFAREDYAFIESSNRKQQVDGFDLVIADGNRGGSNLLDIAELDFRLAKRGIWDEV